MSEIKFDVTAITCTNCGEHVAIYTDEELCIDYLKKSESLDCIICNVANVYIFWASASAGKTLEDTAILCGRAECKEKWQERKKALLERGKYTSEQPTKLQ